MIKIILTLSAALAIGLQAGPTMAQVKKKAASKTARGKKKADSKQAGGTNQSQHPLPPPTSAQFMSYSQVAERRGIHAGIDLKSMSIDMTINNKVSTPVAYEDKTEVKVSGMPVSAWGAYAKDTFSAGLALSMASLEIDDGDSSSDVTISSTRIQPFFSSSFGRHILSANILSLSKTNEETYSEAPAGSPAGTPVPDAETLSPSLHVATIGYAIRHESGLYGLDITEGKSAVAETDGGSSYGINIMSELAFYAVNSFGKHGLGSKLTYDFYKEKNESEPKLSAADLITLRCVYGFNFMPGGEAFGGFLYRGKGSQDLRLTMPWENQIAAAGAVLLAGGQFAIGKMFSVNAGIETASMSGERSGTGYSSTIDVSYTAFNLGAEARF